jgi:alkanesulfonate monooxygenase SsuD/methylene tetrahydromethanopterin reductase-like flavin-dependent oxidoreductase (luciferase family)
MYIGGMGAKGRNFYNELVCRYGYEAEATLVQDLYLSGDKKGALGALPDDLIDELALVGDRRRVADQLDAWRSSGATTLILATPNPSSLRAVAELTL